MGWRGEEELPLLLGSSSGGAVAVLSPMEPSAELQQHPVDKHTTPHRTAPHHTAPHHTAPHHTTPHCFTEREAVMAS
uniref:Uncharacterized protein n=1 Tax=Setaria digitata TaxID=48799 RepID=A0A915PIH0_9BILA